MQFLQSIFTSNFPSIFRGLNAPYVKLECETFDLIRPHKRHFDEWAYIRRSNMGFLQPFEPRWHEHDLQKHGFAQRVKYYEQSAKNKSCYSYFLTSTKYGLMGGISLFNIQYGSTSSGKIGYWLGKEHNGKGYMNEALQRIIKFGFYTLNLERLESACLAHNQRSINLLERNKFLQEGMAKDYLEINGKRQDHLLFARLKSDT